jgi:hypothetical protein
MPTSIASGDFNSDGETDLLLGAAFGDGPDELREDAGEAYVILGPVSGDIDVSDSNADVVLFGAKPGDNLGAGVTSGDLNGDGIDDIIVGASASDAIQAIRTDMGEVYVIFGRADLAATFDMLEQQQDVTFQPAEGFSQLGRALAVGDVNDDGTDDLVAGAPYAGRQPNTPPGGQRTTIGEVYVFYGGSSLAGVVTVASDQEDVRITGLNEYDQFGASVAVADLDGDGVDDIVVGASGYDGSAGEASEAGGLFIFDGSSNLPETVSLADADLALTGARHCRGHRLHRRRALRRRLCSRIARPQRGRARYGPRLHGPRRFPYC